MLLEKNHYSGFAFFWIGYKSTSTILRNLLQMNHFLASLSHSCTVTQKISNCVLFFLWKTQLQLLIPVSFTEFKCKKTFEISIQINSKSIKNNRFVKNVSRTSLYTGGFSIQQDIAARKPLQISHMVVSGVKGCWPLTLTCDVGNWRGWEITKGHKLVLTFILELYA